MKGTVILIIGLAAGSFLAFEISAWLSEKHSTAQLTPFSMALTALLLALLEFVVALVWARRAAGICPADSHARIQRS